MALRPSCSCPSMRIWGTGMLAQPASGIHLRPASGSSLCSSQAPGRFAPLQSSQARCSSALRGYPGADIARSTGKDANLFGAHHPQGNLSGTEHPRRTPRLHGGRSQRLRRKVPAGMLVGKAARAVQSRVCRTWDPPDAPVLHTPEGWPLPRDFITAWQTEEGLSQAAWDQALIPCDGEGRPRLYRVPGHLDKVSQKAEPWGKRRDRGSPEPSSVPRSWQAQRGVPSSPGTPALPETPALSEGGFGEEGVEGSIFQHQRDGPRQSVEVSWGVVREGSDAAGVGSAVTGAGAGARDLVKVGSGRAAAVHCVAGRGLGGDWAAAMQRTSASAAVESPLPPASAAVQSSFPPQRQQESEQNDFHVNVGYAVRRLREDLPCLFYKKPTFEIFRDDITFRDPVNSFSGMQNYRLIFWALRFHGNIFFKALWVDVVRIWQPNDHTIMVRWTVRGKPRVPWETVGTFDGTSEYSLDKTGKIYIHKVDNVALSRPEGRLFQPVTVADLVRIAGGSSTPTPTYCSNSISGGLWDKVAVYIGRVSWVRFYWALMGTLALSGAT